MDDTNAKASSASLGESFWWVGLVLWQVMGWIGVIKLLFNWGAFGDRAVPMLIACFLFPGLGPLWPFLATPDPNYNNTQTMYTPRMTRSSRRN